MRGKKSQLLGPKSEPGARMLFQLLVVPGTCKIGFNCNYHVSVESY